jgi:hypothetical protein
MHTTTLQRGPLRCQKRLCSRLIASVALRFVLIVPGVPWSRTMTHKLTTSAMMMESRTRLFAAVDAALQPAGVLPDLSRVIALYAQRLPQWDATSDEVSGDTVLSNGGYSAPGGR